MEKMQIESSHTKYLESLEKLAKSCKTEDFYLWLDTPVGNLQLEIEQKVGVNDYQIENRHSRPARIIKQIKTLINNGFISDEFSVLDICCGDAVVLWQIKKAFPQAYCYGVDFLKDKINTHQMVQGDGVRLYRAFIQHLFRTPSHKPFDLVIMLNTYWGWKSADLPEYERKLPELADTWFAKNARYTILTARWSQIKCLQQLGFRVIRLGRGEESSTMICISKYRFPASNLLSNSLTLLVNMFKTAVRDFKRIFNAKSMMLNFLI